MPCRLNPALPPAPGPGLDLSETKGLLALRIFAESWFYSWGVGVRRCCLNRVGIGFAGTDADGLFQVDHEDLAVADLAGVGRLGDGLDDAIELIVSDGTVDFYLRQEVDEVFGTATQHGEYLHTTDTLDIVIYDALTHNFQHKP